MDALCITISFSFRYALAHPSIPSRWEGKKYRLSKTYSPSQREGARGWAIQFSPLCCNTDILYAMV
jgi:hypothetical protein